MALVKELSYLGEKSAELPFHVCACCFLSYVMLHTKSPEGRHCSGSPPHCDGDASEVCRWLGVVQDLSVHHAAFCSEMFSRFHTTGLIFSPDLGTTVSSLLGHLSIVACGQFWLSGSVRALSPHPAGRPRECSPAWPRWGHGVTCERSESLCWDRVFLLPGDKVQLPQLPGAECLRTSRVWQNAELCRAAFRILFLEFTAGLWRNCGTLLFGFLYL